MDDRGILRADAALVLDGAMGSMTFAPALALSTGAETRADAGLRPSGA
ncbi:hypothetical protein [Caulobacter sp. RL271]|jgi:hypothetical protein|uniref:Uncharacterized protein n=1 Tax=Caulobacter segnis TaxID=88688 RepID=A0ABY4ZRJ4_9CAUL|nr:hypothetical protein [Caulobacter segnis]USQ95432.1 hypothetical protein MZV50_23260 [Caulobacter segnis]